MIKLLPQIILGAWGILPGNYSGITHVRDNVYAVVDDKDKVDGFKLLTLDIDSVTGKVTHAAMTEPQGMAQRRSAGVTNNRDCEGIAYFPDANTIFVSGEEDQRIMEYTIDGIPTGRELLVPVTMQRDKIASDYGFEALTYDATSHCFWTTTEKTLLADRVVTSTTKSETHNRLRFISFDTSLKPTVSYVYSMDAPEATSKSATIIQGVPSLLALDDGRLIVMEREACLKNIKYGSWISTKLYIVDPTKQQQVSIDTPMQSVKDDVFMHKTLLCQFTTHLRLGLMNLSNYEGMCLGPRLTNGRQTIILIADSQNGIGNMFYHVKDHIRVIVL